MHRDLELAVKEWKAMRKLTLDLLEIIPDDKMGFTVGKNMGTLGKQYRHIGDVQLCYAEAIKTGKIGFDNYRRDYSIENSKEKLKTFLEAADKEMLNRVNENPEAKINWFGETLGLKQHINALIQHEILHHGELIVYIRTLDLQFPESWELWGM